MKSLMALWITATLFSASACSPKPEGRGVMSQPLESGGDVIEMSGDVPEGFFERMAWNDASICPEGAFLGPFTQYIDRKAKGAVQDRVQFGRSCIKVPGAQPAGRTPAASTSTGALFTEIPHGPFMWWDGEGRIVRSGTYVDGVLVQWKSKTQ